MAAKLFMGIAYPIGAAMKKITELFFDDIETVDAAKEADIIVVDNYNQLDNIYSEEKFFVVADFEKLDKKLPENVIHLVQPISIADYAKFLHESNEKLSSSRQIIKNEKEKKLKKESVKIDRPKVLVIDDTRKHQQSAIKLLTSYQLTVATRYEEAMEILSKEKFDFVLSDLYLPMSSQTLSRDAFELGKLVPYGLLLALEASRCGAKYIAVATDLDHHSDCFSASFDHFSRFSFNVDGAKVQYMHAPMIKDGEEWVKNWSEIIEDLKK
jgi:CheY-like chemotaxis protein